MLTCQLPRCRHVLSCLVALLFEAWGFLPSVSYAHQEEHSTSAFFDLDLSNMPTHLNSGAGKVHEAVTTDNSEAAAFYDQGLAWFHSYAFIESARSFHQALRLDPHLAMAELGLARCYYYLDLIDKAEEYYERSRQLSPQASDREQRYIAARLIQWDAINASDEDEESVKTVAYRNALDALIHDYPDDPELWIARGNAEEPDADAKGQVGDESSIPFYQKVLERYPDHPGAHHYLLHCFENLRRYEEAVKHAATYASLAPDAPHAQHMFGHVLPRIGDWAQAVVQFEKTNALEQAYYANEKIPPHLDWHHVHNLTLLGWAYERVGRSEDAIKVLREAFELPTPGRFEGVFDRASYVSALLRLEDYENALEAAHRLADMGGNAGKAIGEALAGQIALAAGNERDARFAAKQASDALDALRAEVDGTADAWATEDVGIYVDTLQSLLNLRDPDPGLQYIGQKSLRDLTEELASGPSFDGWGEGYLHIEGIARTLIAMGNPQFAAELRALRDEQSESATSQQE